MNDAQLENAFLSVTWKERNQANSIDHLIIKDHLANLLYGSIQLQSINEAIIEVFFFTDVLDEPCLGADSEKVKSSKQGFVLHCK